MSIFSLFKCVLPLLFLQLCAPWVAFVHYKDINTAIHWEKEHRHSHLSKDSAHSHSHSSDSGSHEHKRISQDLFSNSLAVFATTAASIVSVKEFKEVSLPPCLRMVAMASMPSLFRPPIFA